MGVESLLGLKTGQNGAPLFNEMGLEELDPAMDRAISLARERLDAIKSHPITSFETVIEALERSQAELESASLWFFNMLSAHSNEPMRAKAPEVSAKLAAFSSDVSLDAELFKKVESVYKNPSAELSVEQRRLLETTYLSFARNGALLNETQKEELRKIDEQLSQLGPKFDTHILNTVNTWVLHLEDPADLEGLPESAVRAAAETAVQKDLSGWAFTLQAPSYIPFLTYSARRGLREKIWRAFNARGLSPDQDNRPLIRQIADLRRRRAQLLGYKNHADFVLRERMSRDVDTVSGFLRRLQERYLVAAERDLDAVKKFASDLDGLTNLKPWDVSYYAEKLKKKLYDFDQEQLRPYFPLQGVIQGAFLHASRLYGLMFKEVKDLPVYHTDVQVFEVSDPRGFVGLLYTDFFPRESKRGGAWMTVYKNQHLVEGQDVRPVVSLVCNFTKPLPDQPSLLTFEEVLTLFHEFGHGLHGLLSKCQYSSLAGTNVYWDFVELPSQIMENWPQTKESLDLFARHYETQQPMPQELMDRLKAANNFFAGFQGLRQVSLATLDMAWASLESPVADNLDAESFEEGATKNQQLLPKEPNTCVSTSFSHIFSGGYSAGYYSYKWAEVLDADAFEYFREKGLFSTEVADSFRRNILSRGGSEHPAELYRRFRGRDPDVDAMFRRDGLLEPAWS